MKVMIPSQTPKWINNDILQLMRVRDSYYARARSLNKADDWNIAKFLHTRVQMAIKAHKSNIIKEDLERYKNNPKKLWEKIGLYEILPKRISVCPRQARLRRGVLPSGGTGGRLPAETILYVSWED